MLHDHFDQAALAECLWTPQALLRISFDPGQHSAHVPPLAQARVQQVLAAVPRMLFHRAFHQGTHPGQEVECEVTCPLIVQRRQPQQLGAKDMQRLAKVPGLILHQFHRPIKIDSVRCRATWLYALVMALLLRAEGMLQFDRDPDQQVFGVSQQCNLVLGAHMQPLPGKSCQACFLITHLSRIRFGGLFR
mmetsp:Transcript_22718/g.36094  ORF Transcript_22718/g.36094 Transcript_22718/m.36094 type:complete len:190 (+) Transcript_22718:1443-2012(+)